MRAHLRVDDEAGWRWDTRQDKRTQSHNQAAEAGIHAQHSVCIEEAESNSRSRGRTSDDVFAVAAEAAALPRALAHHVLKLALRLEPE
jgi:hypothetical protein